MLVILYNQNINIGGHNLTDFYKHIISAILDESKTKSSALINQQTYTTLFLHSSEVYRISFIFRFELLLNMIPIDISPDFVKMLQTMAC